MLESNFSLIGDDGSKNIDDVETPLQKESEHLFTLWCSGRVCCEGMLVELKLLKRQDLVAVISNLMKPGHDQVSFFNSDDILNQCSAYAGFISRNFFVQSFIL